MFKPPQPKNPEKTSELQKEMSGMIREANKAKMFSRLGKSSTVMFSNMNQSTMKERHDKIVAMNSVEFQSAVQMINKKG